MTFLLDTHVFLWLTAQPERVPTPTLRLLSDATQTRLVSMASLWELGIKVGLGKLTLPASLPEFVSSRLTRTVTEVLGVSLEHVLAVADLPHHHGDPFDRMIVAQAQKEDLTLVSADTSLRPYDVRLLWD